MLMTIVVRVIKYCIIWIGIVLLYAVYRERKNGTVKSDDYGIRIVMEKKRGSDDIAVKVERDADISQLHDVNSAGIAMLTDGIVRLATEFADADKVKDYGAEKVADDIAQLVSEQVRKMVADRLAEVVNGKDESRKGC